MLCIILGGGGGGWRGVWRVCGLLQAVRVLLRAGADPTAVDENGRTALDWTCKGRYDRP